MQEGSPRLQSDFEARLGNLVSACYKKETAWW